MHTFVRFFSFTALLATVACSMPAGPSSATPSAASTGSSASTTAPAPAGEPESSVYACVNPGAGRCTQYAPDAPAVKDAAGGVAGVHRLCETEGGTWQVTPCSREGSLGACEKPTTTIVCLDEKCTQAYAKACSVTRGTWTPAA